MVTVGETPAAEAPLQLRKVAHLPLCFRLRSSRGGLLLLYRTGWVIRGARSSLREGGGSNGGGGGGGGRRKGSRPGQVRFSLSLSLSLPFLFPPVGRRRRRMAAEEEEEGKRESQCSKPAIARCTSCKKRGKSSVTLGVRGQ